MGTNRIPKPGEIYKHFKDNQYQIITIATHSENRELMVVYQALYGDFKTYVRPLEMFISEVDHIKYPDIKQKYRFELQSSFEDILHGNQNIKDDSATVGKSSEDRAIAERKIDTDLEDKLKQEKHNYRQLEREGENTSQKLVSVVSNHEINAASHTGSESITDGEVNSILMDFLDESSYSKKLEVLLLNKKHLNDRLINDMAVSLDVAVDEGPLDERIQGLVNCLSALSRFEFRRL